MPGQDEMASYVTCLAAVEADTPLKAIEATLSRRNAAKLHFADAFFLLSTISGLGYPSQREPWDGRTDCTKDSDKPAEAVAYLMSSCQGRGVSTGRRPLWAADMMARRLIS